MKIYLHYLVFIISVFVNASIFNLLAEDSGDIDFWDKLLKEIEQIDEEKTTPVKSEPIDKHYESSSIDKSDSQTTTHEKPKAIVKKDKMTLFLQPDMEDIKVNDKKTKSRPTKETVAAVNYYLDELGNISFSVKNKLETSNNLSPKFKETKLLEFKNELETANSILGIINDKGIYKSTFLSQEKHNDTNKKKIATDTKKNIRHDILDVIKLLQKLESDLGEQTSDSEPGIETLQNLANQDKKSNLPTYEPLSVKKKTTLTKKLPDSADKQEQEPLLEEETYDSSLNETNSELSANKLETELEEK